MVKVREDHPVFRDGTVNLKSWMARINEHIDVIDEQDVLRACKIARIAEEEAIAAENIWSEGTSSYRTGLEMAEILAELNMDQDAIVAAVLYRAVREGKLSNDTVRDQFGPVVSALIDGVARMAAIHTKSRSTRAMVLGQTENQGDAIRKMLVSMIDDVRVALIKLAERTCAIRAVKHAAANKRYHVAREVFDIYAPLAHRLGVGHLKWELEDLSFRYIEPQQYKKIAKLIDEKRINRQDYIDRVISQISEALDKMNIKGDIFGRAKHIYSIWRKMQRKKIGFSQVYDIRAVRIMVPSVQDCYQVLGVVHSFWRNIPKEFDDYIASPKANGYRSLHTAVIGPEGKVLEIQIRTSDMHQDAELGVCAHWKYKGTDDSENASDRGYEDKIAWLRQVLEWHEELGDGDIVSIAEQIGGQEDAYERLYVLTPDGHIVDVNRGATPIDFAYKVHTEVGHKCRGAKVNGRIVPLTYKLKMGDQVEILTSNQAKPSRDWLSTELKFVNTARARAKIKHWFKSQDREQNIVEGRVALHRELSRFNLPKVDNKQLAASVNFHDPEDMFAAIGAGDLSLLHVVHAAENMVAPQKPKLPALKQSTEKQTKSGDLNIQGVGNLMTQIAGCCQPVPGDPVMGYITQGRGVSIHRKDCTNILQLNSTEPERILQVSWGNEVSKTYPVDLAILAYDRTGLLRDVMLVLANQGINITKVNTLSNKDESMADIELTVEIKSNESLATVFTVISSVENVIDVHRAIH